jgi:hypothetical protein
VTDMRDPFSGLPKGLYIYQGKKYLKRNWTLNIEH